MKMFRVLKQNDGAAMIEFAIVFPLFLALTFGIIEFGIIMYNKAIITNASREGARFGILFEEDSKTSDDIKNRVKGVLGVDPDNPDKSRLISLGGSAIADITFPDGFPPTNEYFSVTVMYPYKFLILQLGSVVGLPEELKINTTTTMRME